MAVYVDELFSTTPYHETANRRWNWLEACHLVGDSEEELLDFGLRRLKLHKSWYQDKEKSGKPYVNRFHCHFDLNKNKRELAVACGAVEMTRYEGAVRTLSYRRFLSGEFRKEGRFFWHTICQKDWAICSAEQIPDVALERELERGFLFCFSQEKDWITYIRSYTAIERGRKNVS